MKIITCLMTSLLISIGLHAQGPIKDKFKHEILTEDDQLRNSRNEGDLLDSILSWTWNEFDQSWGYYDRYDYQYDGQGKTINYVNSSWDGTIWQPSYKTNNSFDENGLKIAALDQNWDGTMWINNHLTTYERDANGNITLILSQNWNGTAWDNYFNLQYTYTVDNLKETVLTQEWDTDHWLNTTLITNAYENNKLDTALTQSWDTLSGWMNSFRNLYSYGANGQVEEVMYQSWDFPGWADDLRTHYEYDVNGNNTLILREKKLGSNSWQNVYQHIYDYDSVGNFHSDLYQTWANNNWKNSSYYEEGYDVRHNLISTVNRYWSDVWVNSDSSRYYYTLSSGLADARPASHLTIFPNPASSFLMIDEPGNWTIYSSSGMVVLRSNHEDQYSQLIDISRLIPGVYSLVVQRENGKSAEQFLKL